MGKASGAREGRCSLAPDRFAGPGERVPTNASASQHTDNAWKRPSHETRNLVLGVLTVLCLAPAAASAQTLKAVKDRGSLICGVSQGLAGFSNPDDKGNWTGFDVDFCRAIAAAIFNDAEQGQVHAALRQGSVRTAQVRRHRRAVAQHHLDAVARRLATAISPASPITTARASWCARRSRSIRRSSSTAPRSAPRPAPPPSSTSPTSSAPTT